MSSLLVLLFDLDHTLIHSEPDIRKSSVPGFWINLSMERRYVHVRPHALELLEWLTLNDRPFGFWTAATREYAEAVVSGLFRILGIDTWRSSILVCTRARRPR